MNMLIDHFHVPHFRFRKFHDSKDKLGSEGCPHPLVARIRSFRLFDDTKLLELKAILIVTRLMEFSAKIILQTLVLDKN